MDEIGSSGAKLDGNGISVNKWETFGKKSGNGHSAGGVPGSSYGGGSSGSGNNGHNGGTNSSGINGGSNNSGNNYKQMNGGKNGQKNVGNGGGAKKSNKFGGNSVNDGKNNSGRAASGRGLNNGVADDDDGGKQSSFISRYNGERDDSKNGGSKKRGCFRCGRNGHFAKQCYAKVASVKHCETDDSQSTSNEGAFLFNSILRRGDNTTGSG